MPTPKAIVRPELLVWAREAAGFSQEMAARRLQKRIDQLQAWETGEDQPTLAQLRQIAQVYKRPFSDFYLPRVPEESPPPRDFRRLPGEVALTYSPPLRYQLRLADHRRRIFRELCTDLGLPVPRFELHGSLADDRELLGLRIRESLRITPGEQRTWRDPRRAYKAWRTAIEARGVLTFQIIGVPPAEVLGFSFACEELSVIGVNQKVRPNGRIFTLLHELVHVVLSYSSLCDLEEEAPRPAQEQEVEVFCNAVAAAALVPRQTLLENDLIRARGAGHHEWSNEELEAVARSFAVSEEVILRRLVFTDRASQAFYRAKRMEYLARYARLETEEREAAAEQEMRRNMPREALSNLGSSYTRLVLDSFNQDQITLTDASRYLGLKAKHIAKLEDLALAE